MDTREKLIKARLGLLALAEQLQNVRQACKGTGPAATLSAPDA